MSQNRDVSSRALPLRPLWRTLLCGIVLTWGAGQATARTLDDEEALRLPLEDLLQVEVFSASRYVRELSGAPTAASVVTAADIRAHGYRNMTDILRSLPGLYVTYDRGYSYLGSRGYGKVGDWNSRVLFLVDGHRVNENIYDGAYIGNDFIVDVALIDRVEYVAGPAAAMLYGNNAFFGVVNVVTKRGGQIDGVELAAGVGNAAARNGRASYGRRLANGLDVLVSLSGLDNDGRALPIAGFGTADRGMDRERAERLFAKLDYGGLTLEVAHAERRKHDPTAAYQQVFNDPRSQTTDAQSLVDLGYNHPLGADSAVSGRLYYGQYDYHGDSIYDLAAAPPADLQVFRDIGRGRWWGLDLKYVSGNLNGHKLLVGADYQRDLDRDQQGGYLGFPRVLDDRRSDRQWGLYVHDTISLGEALLVDAGVRHDRPAVGRSELNPRLGLSYRWQAATTLKALYGSAFRPPNVFERYYDAGDQYKPNPDLAPERIRSRELVLEHALGGDRQLVATVFHNDIKNLIEYVRQDGADGIADTADDFLRFENAGRVHSGGIELRYEQPLADAGRFRASYTGQRTRNADGAEPENSPRHLAKLDWRRPLFASAWNLGFELQYLGARRSYAGTRIGAATLANLSLSTGRLFKDLEVAATVFNLFDRRFADPAAYFHDPLDRIVQDGRRWQLQFLFHY